jgi:DNA-binding transcriptional MocR family regulator
MTIWMPQLSGHGPIYRQLAQAIGQAVENGDLQAGHKLPTHRALADQLGVTVGTITRAYAEAEHQGWLTARVGAGTYVREEALEPAISWHIRQPDPSRIELWQNLPILQDRETAFRGAIEALLASPGRINALMEYSSVNGELAQREIVCAWLNKYGFSTATPDRLFFSFGSQNGLLLSLMTCGTVGETVLCEHLTYPGLSTLCHPLRIQMKGLAMDDEGLLPQALEKACQSGSFRTLYLNPTIQNPTTSIMSLSRRQEILALCERFQLTIIEDDVHGTLPEVRPPAFVELAPERVIHLGSFAKNTSAGLRIGYMLVPDSLHSAMSIAVRGSSWMITPLMIELTCQWLQSGQADQMLLQQRKILRQRGELLQHHLGDYQIQYQAGGMHAWLPLPTHWRSQAFVQAADQAGVGVAGAELFTAGHAPSPQAVRLSISHPADNLSLDKALVILRQLLDSEPTPQWVI